MNDFKRFSLRPIVIRHHHALRGKGKTSLSGSAVTLLYVVPVLLGFAVGWIYNPVPHGDIPLTTPLIPVLTVAGTLIGGLLAVFALLFNLRVKLHERADIPQGNGLYRLIAQTAVTSSYLIIPAAFIVLLSLMTSIGWAQLALSVPWILQIAVGLIVALGAHIFFNAVTIVRRLFALYHRLYAGDFSPDLRLIQGRERDQDSA